MTAFYIFSLLLEIILFVFLKSDKTNDIYCYKSRYVLVLTNRGAGYILGYNLVSFSYTLLMIFTFYYLLKRDGMAIKEHLTPIVANLSES